jgi:hypothetical protein
MAIALLPAVYKNAFDPDKPILIQLCALFASGLGWQSCSRLEQRRSNRALLQARRHDAQIA